MMAEKRPIADLRYLAYPEGMVAIDLKRVAFAVLLLFALGWYAYTRAHVPAASTVNGIYSNPCCGTFELRNGTIVIGASRIPFDLENMKFGLTAYPTQQILVRGGRVEAIKAADPGPLSFEENGGALTVCGDRLCDQVYRFKRNPRISKPS